MLDRSPIQLAREPAFQLGRLHVEPASREVVHGAQRQVIEPRLMQVLIALARADGAPVTREDLTASCWDGRVVGEDAISRVVAGLRGVASGIGGGSFRIETLTKVGFRLVVQSPEPDRRASATPDRRAVFAASGVLAVAAAVGGTWLAMRRTAPPVADARVAILPFETLGGGQTTRDFATGLTEKMLGVLSANQIEAISHTGDLGRDALGRLRVGLLLGGAVRAEQSRLHVSIRLDEAREHVTLWSKDFLGDLSNPEALQAEVASRTADMTNWAIVGRAAGGQTIDSETLAAFIQGSDELSNGGERAIPILRQVVARAPRFADGYSHLAVALAGAISQAPKADQPAILADTQSNAKRALALDPNLGEAYLALQVATPLGAWRDREALMRKGLGVDPNFPYLNFQYATFLGQVGRNTDSLAVAQRAVALNPLFVYASAYRANRLTVVGQVDQGRAAIDETARLWPQSPMASWGRFYIAALSGAAPTARALLDDPKTRPLTATARGVEIWDAVLKVRDSKSASERAGAAHTVATAADAGEFDRRDAVLALALLGDVDEALLQAERFYGPERLSASLGPALPLDMAILFHPATQALRRDPRFMVLAAKLGLVAYWRKSGKWPDFAAEPSLSYDVRAEAARLVPA